MEVVDTSFSLLVASGGDEVWNEDGIWRSFTGGAVATIVFFLTSCVSLHRKNKYAND